MRGRSVALAVVLAGAAAVLALRPWETKSPGEGDPLERHRVPTPGGDGLAAKPPTLETGGAAPVLRGAVVGAVRRQGQGVVTWVELYRLRAVDVATPSRWHDRADEPSVLSVDPADARPAATTQSAFDGRYQFEGLDAGEYEVVASTPDGLRGFARARVTAVGARASADIELRGGKERLVGRAVRVDGKPFDGEISTMPADVDDVPVRSLRFARLGAKGEFVLEGLDGSKVIVIARGAAPLGAGRLVAYSEPVALPRRDEFVFVVDAGRGAISGRVVADTDGAAIAGARVVAQTGGRSGSEADVVTDAEGRFAVVAAAGARSTLYVRAPGFASIQRSAPDPLAPVELRLARSGRVRGHVLAGGRTIAGVDVFAMPAREPFRDGAHAVSDASGRYTLEALAPGERTVFAIGHGWMSADLEAASPRGFNPFTVVVPAGGSVDRDLVVVAAGCVAGRVVDPDGKPVAGASVQWSAADERPAAFARGGGAFVLQRDVATIDDGTFLLDAIPAGSAVEIEASATGFSTGTAAKAVAVAADTATSVPSVEIRLAPPRWLTVRVEDAEAHAPIAEVDVQVTAVSQVGHTHYSVQVASAQTSSDGVVLLGPLPLGPIEVHVSGPGLWFESVPGADKLPAAGGSLVAKVKRQLVIAGRVHYADGTPVAGGVHVEGSSMSSGAGIDDDGRFSVTCDAPGNYRLTIKPIGGAEIVRDVRAGGGSLGAIDVVIPGSKPPARIAEVVNADGQPIASARAWVVAGGDRGNATVVDGRVSIGVRTEDAWIEVFDATEASGAKAAFGAAVVGPIRPGDAAPVIRLTREKTIDGVVVDPEGRGVALVRVSAVPKRGEAFGQYGAPHDDARTDESGRFHLGRLWDGPYRLEVAPPPRFSAPSAPVSAVAGATDARIVLARPFVVTARVLDASGTPVVGAEVEVFLSEQFDGSSVRRTDRDGVVSLPGLDPARPVEIRVKPPEGADDLLPLQVERWTPSAEPLRLAKGVSLRGVVRDRDGHALSGADVLVSQPAAWREATSDANGQFVVKGLTEGDVEVIATSDKPARRSRVVKAASNADEVVLVMQPTGGLVVRLAGLPPNAVGTRARLVDAASSVSTINAQVAEDGVARFEGLDPDATYVLVARVNAPERIALRRGVKAADREITIEPAPTKSIFGRVVLPAGATHARVYVSEAGVSASTAVGPSGGFELGGLPDGQFTVRARATAADGASLVGSSVASSGDAPGSSPAEILLAPAK